MVARPRAVPVLTMPLTHFSPTDYPALLDDKVQRVLARFSELDHPQPQIHASPPTAYRMRAEFRIWHEGEDLFYAMFDPAEPKTPLRVDEFPIASERIQRAMPMLRDALLPIPILRRKLFQVEFLSTLSGELLVSLIYHRSLDEEWEGAARRLEVELGASIIGRSRGQKRVLSRDYVDEVLPVSDRDWRYRQFEQGFTQPNAQVNCAMIEWACEQAAHCDGDLLELYCGNGNFTMPLAQKFPYVLATEVSKKSIAAAQYNRAANGVDNLELARLSAEEVASALAGEREFRRLGALERPLAEYDFGTVFVDPPRAGLDPATIALACGFDNIIYISCNPDTLASNLVEICKSHKLERLAMFDQFPYTDHMECGAWLRRRSLDANA